MPTKKHLLNQVDLIAERRRNESGELHPFRKHKIQCKGCGKEIEVRERNLLPDGNYCRKHRRLIPGWLEAVNQRAKNRSPEWLEKQIERNRANAKDQVWLSKVKNGSRERSKDPEYLKKTSAALQGIPIGEWQCFTHYAPYCPKFNSEFKEGVRRLQGYRCALCGHIWQPGEKKLAIHHVHNRKDSCCAKDAPTIFVALCANGCHHKTIKHWRHYVRRFTHYIQKNFNGKSYLTKEEIENAR